MGTAGFETERVVLLMGGETCSSLFMTGDLTVLASLGAWVIDCGDCLGIGGFDVERVALFMGEDICSSWSRTGDFAALYAGDSAITGDRAVLLIALSSRPLPYVSFLRYVSLLPYVSTASDCVLRA